MILRARVRFPCDLELAEERVSGVTDDLLGIGDPADALAQLRSFPRGMERSKAGADILDGVLRRRVSLELRFWRVAHHSSRARLPPAPPDVANARPTCAKRSISRTFSATLTITATNSAFTGVEVSPRAWNVTVALRINTNGSRPMA